METLGDLYQRIQKNANVQETLREALFHTYQSLDLDEFNEDSPNDGFDDAARLIEAKRDELHQIMENLDEHIGGKSPKEIAAFFSSILDIYNQLYIHSTQGVISVRIRLIDYIPQTRNHVPPPVFYHEISMIYAPEEIRAMQKCLETMEKTNPLYYFFMGVLDKAFDANQFNETSSYLLLEIANYFIMQLEKKRNGEEVAVFKERFAKNKRALDRTANEYRELEVILNGHMSKYPVLAVVPNMIRSLILIRFGVVEPKYAPEILHAINNNMKAYNQAKRVVSFDFSRMPPMQQAMIRKQEMILKFQMEVLSYTGEVLEKDFSGFIGEYERMMVEIETKSAQVDSNDPRSSQLVKQKRTLQTEYEQRRKSFDVLKCQQSLVEVQQKMIESSLTKFESEGSMHGEVHKSFKSGLFVEDKPKPQEKEDPEKKNRMASMDRREKEE
ncbi:MAG: hypothetical protein P9L94_01660 [Candidatus Hinthialibacter antarcticus]|nr:hypothetical protein [Candidatus Hinthialibacter antarcticus]